MRPITVLPTIELPDSKTIRFDEEQSGDVKVTLGERKESGIGTIPHSKPHDFLSFTIPHNRRNLIANFLRD
jgi:hypothetical protein